MASWTTTMTPEEMRECRCLLDFSSDEDLASLKDTVVGRKLVVENRRKTIKVILQCSSSAEELLQRRKIRREILFQYLLSKSITIASTTEKSVLIKKILALWSSLPPVYRNPKSSASNTWLATPTSQRSTSGTAVASNICLAAPTSQKSVPESATASRTYLAAPTSQRSTSETATASRTYLAAPTSQRSTSETATASRTYLAESSSHRSSSETATASRTYLAAPTSQRSTSETATTSRTYLAASTSQRSTSETATTFRTYLAAPTSQRSTSETATTSNQPLQQTTDRSSFYKDTKTQSVLKATESNINRVTPPIWPSTSGTLTVSSQLLQATLSNRGSQVTASSSTCAAPTSWPSASGTLTVSSQLLQVTFPNSASQERWNEGNSTNQVFGESFVRWFYRLLNAENPAIHLAFEGDKFGPQHFWENCSMRIISQTSNRSDQTFTGGMSVSNRLKALARDEHLLFHPNVSMEGVRTMKSPYGLFMLMVCGTIHHNNACLGIYHQVFGLVCNPLQDNNWKIQVTHLHVESLDDASVIPRLSISADQDMLAVASAHAKSP